MRRREGNRWVILGVGITAQMTSCMYLYGIPMLVPQLRRRYHLGLAGAGWVVAAPTVGLLLTLVAWGAVADRRGERVVMASGLGMGGVALGAAAAANGLLIKALLLGLAGAAGASVNAASGRMVLGWFPPEQRGAAMGARQTAQPLGVGLAAVVLPPVARAHGIDVALAVPAVACVVVAAAVALLVVDPARSSVATAVASGSPYRVPTLWRLHAASTLLVVPQFAVAAFALEYLVTVRHWGPAAAGRLVFAFQVAGAAGRLATGWWSDRAGSRLGPMRLVAVAAAATMALVAIGTATGSLLAVVGLGVATVVTVADNGLGFTAVAELAGSAWAGRALGAQNTAQNVAAALTPPLLGAVIASAGYATGFGVAALFPLVAVAATPVAAEVAGRRRAGIP